MSIMDIPESVETLIRKLLHELTVIRETLGQIEESFGNYTAANKAANEADRDKQEHETKVAGEIWFPEAIERKRGAQEGKQHTTQKVIAVAAWFAFIAALAYAVIAQLTLNQIADQTTQIYHQSDVENANASFQAAQAFRQLQAQQAQAQAARESVAAVTKQMREDQRAWLTISMGQITLGEGKAMSVPLTVANIGKTPAKKFVLNAVIQAIENTRSAGSSLAFKYEGIPHLLEFGGYVLQSDPINTLVQREEFAADGKTVQIAIMDHDQAIRMSTGNDFIIVYAEARYKDIFGVSHWCKAPR
jgi:hypothetical protein